MNAYEKTGNATMSKEMLAGLGDGHVAYIRKISTDDFVALFPEIDAELGGMAPGPELFALFRANGQPILLTDDESAAIANAAEHDLHTVSVH